jgi:hypothetical protein
MVGVLDVAGFAAGEADLVKSIAKLGYNDTPLFNTIMKGVPSKSADTNLGHNWNYEISASGDGTAAFVEGSAPADLRSPDIGSSMNHYQIIKDTYGVTGSMEGVNRTDGTDELANSGADASINHRKKIEKMLFGTQTPVKGVKATTTAGISGGLDNWMTVNNTVDATTGALTMQLLREMLKINYLNGRKITHIYMADIQKDRLDDILTAKNMVNTLGAKVLEGTNYMTLTNMAYAQNVKIILSPFVAADEIIAVDHSSLALVFKRLTKPYVIARTTDEVKKEIISELTLRVNNPYGVSKLTNLAIA